MKKLLIALVLSSAALAGCDTDTPKPVAMQYVNALKSGQYEQAITYMHFNNAAEEDCSELRSYLADRYRKSIEVNGGIKDITIQSEKIVEKGSLVDIVERTIYKNGVEADYVMHFVKVDGVWMIDTNY